MKPVPGVYFKIDLIFTALSDVHFLYRKLLTFWVTDKELPTDGQE